MKLTPLAVFAAGVAGLLVATPAMAETKMAENTYGSSIQYYGDARPGKYDKKLEAAMIRKAAEKIGDLRGSVDGLDEDYIIDNAELEAEKSSWLGFPVIEETIPARAATENSIPLV